MKSFHHQLALPFVVVVLFVACSVGFADPGAAQNYLGINIGTTTDWEGNIIFADAMKSANSWGKSGVDLPASSLDAQGWPKVAADLVVWNGLSRDNSGTYALSFESDAAVTVTPALQNISRNAATKVTTAQLVLTGPSPSLSLSFSDPVRNVKLMRPVSPGSGVSHAPTDDFSKPFLNAIAPFQALRFMDFSSTYGNPQVNWSERVQPDYASFNVPDPNYSWVGRGGAWEYIIKLCNQTKKDAWICVPLKASDDFIHQLARLFRDGNAFTGNVGLDPSLKLYVEYDNEVWNTAGDFDGNRNHDLAVAEKNAGDPYHYNYDASGNDWFWAWRRVARRGVDVSLIFRQEFGDARMMTQVRPVFEWQLGYALTGFDALEYLEGAYLPAIASSKPVSYFFYAGGGSAYYSPDTSGALTLANFWQSGTMDAAVFASDGLRADAQVATTFGIKRVAYEGGPSLDSTGNAAIDSVQAQAWADARMGAEITEHHTVWSQWGGDLLMYFSIDPKDYQWGFTRAIDDLTLPKYVAAAALVGAPRAAINHFNAIPAIVQGNQFDIAYIPWDTPGASGSRTIPSGQWLSYIFNATADTAAAVTANYSAAAGGRLSLVIDGVEATFKTASGSGAIATNVNWSKGLHSVRVRTTGGDVTLNSVSVGTTSAVDTIPPSVPASLVATASSPTAVTLTWSPSTDNFSVTGYRVYRAGSLIGTSSTNTFADAGLAPSTLFTYAVSAYDAAGNSSAQSTSISVTTPAIPSDQQAPTTPSGLTASGLTSTSVVLSWNASSDNVAVVGYDVFRNGTKQNPALVTVTTLAVTGLSPATTYGFSVVARDAAGNQSPASAALTVTTSTVVTPLPAPWVSQDIGSTAIVGSASAAGGTFTVTASGADIWGMADGFRFVEQNFGATGQITARVASQTNSDPWAKSGIMIRQSLAPDSAYVCLVATPSSGIVLQRRTATGVAADEPAIIAGGAPVWLRLTRDGNNLVAYRSADGVAWIQIGTTTCTLGTSVFAGLAVSAHSGTATSTAVFDNVSIAPLPTGGSKVLNFTSRAAGLLPNPYNDATGYTLSGDFTVGGADPLRVLAVGTNKVLINNNWSSQITLTKTGGGVFDLASFRYASDPWNGLADAVVTGTKANGSTVVANYSATSTTFQLLSLNWTGLTKVIIQFSGGTTDAYGMVDDFTVSP